MHEQKRSLVNCRVVSKWIRLTVPVLIAGLLGNNQVLANSLLEQLEIEKKAEQQKLKKYLLTVNTSPDDAKIRIMNIVPKYHDGMGLKAGQYDVLVEKEGYQSYRQWLYLSKDTVLSVSLNIETPAATESEQNVEEDKEPIPQHEGTLEAKKGYATEGFDQLVKVSRQSELDKERFCRLYAQVSTRQAIFDNDNQCHVEERKPRQWVLVEQPQYMWCLDAAVARVVQQAEYREDWMIRCEMDLGLQADGAYQHTHPEIPGCRRETSHHHVGDKNHIHDLHGCRSNNVVPALTEKIDGRY